MTRPHRTGDHRGAVSSWLELPSFAGQPDEGDRGYEPRQKKSLDVKKKENGGAAYAAPPFSACLLVGAAGGDGG
jgi:hypothetical protein